MGLFDEVIGQLAYALDAYRLSAIVIAHEDGFHLAHAARTGFDATAMAAGGAMAARILQQAARGAGLARAEEYMVEDGDGQRLVCRRFTANAESLLLIMVLPTPIPYRRNLARLCRALQRALALKAAKSESIMATV